MDGCMQLFDGLNRIGCIENAQKCTESPLQNGTRHKREHNNNRFYIIICCSHSD